MLPVGELDAAYDLKRRNPSFLLFGERGGVPPEGFDSGNSPPAVAAMNLHGKTIIITTSAGTQGIVGAAGADEVLVGCFLNARAVSEYLLAGQPREACLVAMGVNGAQPTPEDDMCAAYIRSMVLGEEVDFDHITETIMKHPEAKKFFDEGGPSFNPDDVHFSLRPNVYSIVPRYVENVGLVAV